MKSSFAALLCLFSGAAALQVAVAADSSAEVLFKGKVAKNDRGVEKYEIQGKPDGDKRQLLLHGSWEGACVFNLVHWTGPGKGVVRELTFDGSLAGKCGGKVPARVSGALHPDRKGAPGHLSFGDKSKATLVLDVGGA
ncbi:MAG TPA: hypothetical protein VL588_08040 [Bdellovibrionota bacterium]|jgi:hypothetical protein|nr:hypothetical protein [Bdellovibrionota bacterium]